MVSNALNDLLNPNISIQLTPLICQNRRDGAVVSSPARSRHSAIDSSMGVSRLNTKIFSIYVCTQEASFKFEQKFAKHDICLDVCISCINNYLILGIAGCELNNIFQTFLQKHYGHKERMIIPSGPSVSAWHIFARKRETHLSKYSIWWKLCRWSIDSIC